MQLNENMCSCSPIMAEAQRNNVSQKLRAIAVKEFLEDYDIREMQRCEKCFKQAIDEGNTAYAEYFERKLEPIYKRIMQK